jgi:hypothetical protein
MDLLSDTLGATPVCCPECQSEAMLGARSNRRGFIESPLERR